MAIFTLLTPIRGVSSCGINEFVQFDFVKETKKLDTPCEIQLTDLISQISIFLSFFIF